MSDISGHKKDIDIKTSNIEAFGSNVSANRLYRRSEKMLAAVYLITAHMPDTEPLRLRLRACGVSLLAQTLLLRKHMRLPESSQHQVVISSLRELSTLVQMLPVGGFVSRSNADILFAAIEELSLLLTAAQQSYLGDDPVLRSVDMTEGEPSQNKGHFIKDSRKYEQKSEQIRVIDQAKDTITARKERIFGLLTTQNPLGIKDISAQLPEYSEKMIQRELSALTQAGKVRKVGAKRWSRYLRVV